MKTIKELRVLFIQEENGWWSAQALELDIAAQAKTPTDLRYEFEKILMAYVVLNQKEDVFAKLGEAPKEYWDMYEHAELEIVSDRDVISSDALEMPKREIKIASALAA